MAQKNRPRPSHAATPQRAAASTDTPEHGSSTVHETVAAHDDAARDSWLGTDRGHRPSNISWGAILAGVVTFLAVLVLLGVLATALGLSAVGGIANTAAQATQVSPEQIGAAAQDAQGQVSEQDVQQAQDQAQQAADEAARTFEENRDELAQGAWWTFGGLLLGGLVSSLAGVAGARAVHRRETELRNGTGRRVDA